ncbi:hypothetical protein Golob_012946 [Gossypium lobatum]|uniref:Uncharacterized protein n=1 Tax=Gossypium lobatum TaxID=34289 RepID=A0A7J8LMW3_9ROSI|nr:hypothetical protein [Gossypium lobatum]
MSNYKMTLELDLLRLCYMVVSLMLDELFALWLFYALTELVKLTHSF